eukprot:s3100_g7.t1
MIEQAKEALRHLKQKATEAEAAPAVPEEMPGELPAEDGGEQPVMEDKVTVLMPSEKVPPCELPLWSRPHCNLCIWTLRHDGPGASLHTLPDCAQCLQTESHLIRDLTTYLLCILLRAECSVSTSSFCHIHVLAFLAMSRRAAGFTLGSFLFTTVHLGLASTSCSDATLMLESCDLSARSLLQRNVEFKSLSAVNDSFDLHKELSLLFLSAARESCGSYLSIASLVTVSCGALILAIIMYLALQFLTKTKTGSDPEEMTNILRGLPSQVSMMALDQCYFTPDLVVPDGCECILYLLARPRRGQPYDVLDSSGGVVLRIADPQPVNPVLRRALLSSSNVELAQIICSESLSPKPEVIRFQLLNGNQDFWATLTYEIGRESTEDKCIIERPRQMYYFFGSFQHGSLNMTDSFGRLLATTAPCAPMVRGEALRLRCAPATDVGLAVCALMCMQAAAQ